MHKIFFFETHLYFTILINRQYRRRFQNNLNILVFPGPTLVINNLSYLTFLIYSKPYEFFPAS